MNASQVGFPFGINEAKSKVWSQHFNILIALPLHSEEAASYLYFAQVNQHFR